MITVQQEHRSGLSNQAEEWPLQRVAFSHGIEGNFANRRDTEIIAHTDVKIRIIGGSIEQGARI